MNLNEMFNRILIESGQFLLEVNGIELDSDKFVILVKTVLGTFNKYDPIDKKFNLDMRYSRVYTFTDDSDPLGIPEWISSVTPLELGTQSSTGFYPIRSSGSLLSHLNYRTQNSWLEEKCLFPFEYRKPTLHLPSEELVDIHAIYFHKVVESEVDGQFIYDVPSITHSDEHFFDLLRAKFMISIGRSRRAFTLQDLPISSDADQIVGEGKELEEKTIESLYENDGKQYLSFG